MRRYGRWTGAALATIAYGGVHVVTGNFTLMAAAVVAGAHWCALYAAGVPLGALIISHTAWDVWIFLVQPTMELPPRAPDCPQGGQRSRRLRLAPVIAPATPTAPTTAASAAGSPPLVDGRPPPVPGERLGLGLGLGLGLAKMAFAASLKSAATTKLRSDKAPRV